jgi:hypothetical protein
VVEKMMEFAMEDWIQELSIMDHQHLDCMDYLDLLLVMILVMDQHHQLVHITKAIIIITKDLMQKESMLVILVIIITELFDPDLPIILEQSLIFIANPN